ncbi:alpha/beta hydrolase [Marinicauda salina]|uniref:Alpha/beta hydrolase n=2 Tax=Marinicauda salina TaxID=2135793 RepID=A0A2U2BSB1_9PROT|nr:alpha/beta hydrolase [Marinicauda salina]
MGLDGVFGAAKTAPGMRDVLAKAAPFMDVEPPAVETVEDIHIAGGAGPRAARVYVPWDAEENGAGLVFFHGGGFMVGSIETHHPLCQRLAAVSGVRVVSVDYRLAPEHRFPAAVDDALAAWDTVKAGRLEGYGFNPDRLAVGGDSAGGNLAAVITQARRSEAAFQLLLYPLLQLVEIRKKKMRWQEGPLLSTEMLAQIREAYLPEPGLASDPRVSPLLASDLHGLPPAFMVSAELDPLLAEGKAYADKLAAFGVPVRRIEVAGVPHGFLNMSKLVKQCVPTIGEAGRALAKALGER